MRCDILSYEADGLVMESHLYVDDSRADSRPGVLVFPEAFGLGDHAKGKARKLAELGYAALACDLHGQGRIMTDRDAMMAELDGVFDTYQEDGRVAMTYDTKVYFGRLGG